MLVREDWEIEHSIHFGRFEWYQYPLEHLPNWQEQYEVGGGDWETTEYGLHQLVVCRFSYCSWYKGMFSEGLTHVSRFLIPFKHYQNWVPFLPPSPRFSPTVSFKDSFVLLAPISILWSPFLWRLIQPSQVSQRYEIEWPMNGLVDWYLCLFCLQSVHSWRDHALPFLRSWYSSSSLQVFDYLYSKNLVGELPWSRSQWSEWRYRIQSWSLPSVQSWSLTELSRTFTSFLGCVVR